MASLDDLERRVAALETERTWTTRLTAKVDQLEAKIEQLDSRITRLETKMDRLEARMDRLETTVNERFDKVGLVLEEILRRLPN